MNEREICTHRPDLCGEPLAREEAAPGTGTVDMAEALKEWLSRQAAEPNTLTPPPTPPPTPESPAPPAPLPPDFKWGALIKIKGLLSSYWRIVNTPYAGVNDVVVVKNPQEVYVLRREKKGDKWLEPPDNLFIPGHVEKQFCVYGFVLQRSIELIAQLFKSGQYALVLGCDRRAVVKPPRRFEHQQIWRYEGYIVNASPARLAVIRLDEGAKRKIAIKYFSKGCPIYSLWANQLLSIIGVPVQLTC